MSPVLLEEILINAIAKNLDGLGHIAVGASSPIPGAALYWPERAVMGACEFLY